MRELQLATELFTRYNRRSPFDFLQNEWRNLIDHAWYQVSEIGKVEHQKRKMVGGIGRPSKEEVRKLLIEERGDCQRAAKKCCETRMKKVCALFAFRSKHCVSQQSQNHGQKCKYSKGDDGRGDFQRLRFFIVEKYPTKILYHTIVMHISRAA